MKPSFSFRIALVGAVAVSCFGCSGSTDSNREPPPAPTSGNPLGNAGAASSAAVLTLPVGTYTGCTTATVGVSAHSTGTAGGDGTITLSAGGDGTVTAALSFDLFEAGTVVFAPLGNTSAGLSGGPFEIATVDAAGLNATVPVTAASLTVAGDTLFVSVYGQNGDSQFSGYSICPLPTSLPSATVVGAPATGSIPTSTYAGCTSSFGSDSSRTGVADLSLTIADNNGTLTATQSAGFPAACDLAFHDAAGTTATLSDAQTCTMPQPCPSPSLGTSSAPSEATLTNMVGSIALAGSALFVNVVGDAPTDACGRHNVSFICPHAP